MFLYVAVTLPLAGNMAQEPTAPSLLLADATGDVFASRGHFRGEWLTPDQPPAYVPQAVLAMEDRRFYSHPGIDIVGIVRAAFVNLRAGEIREGGSTITQQLAKMMFLSPERSFTRKAKEAAIAVWLELQLGKDEILARYLNTVYFGGGAYGIDGAAQRYFGKSARELTLAETAMLVGLIKAPSQFSPARDVEAARERATVVLDAMVEDGAIDPAQAEAAKRTPANLPIATAQGSFGSNFFADWIAREVGQMLGPVRGDFRVDTTLDPELQETAEQTIATWLTREGPARNVGEAALVALGYDGAVLAMVGGRDYGTSQFNRVTQARRQVGSAFKLFVYLAAIEAGYTPNSEVVDRPVAVGSWSPDNFGGTFRGPVTLRTAFAESLNSVSVQLTEEVGHARVIAIARALGLESPIADVPSLALGTSEHTLLELTRAYASVAANTQVAPYGVRTIAAGGRPLYERHNRPGPPLMSWHRAQILDLLRASVRSGTGRGASYGRPAAGKTGTTQEYRDAWFIGFTADAIVGVWVGNDDNAAMKGVTGGSLPAAIWRDFMRAADARKSAAVKEPAPSR